MKKIAILTIVSGLSLAPAIWWLPTHIAAIYSIIILAFQAVAFYHLIAQNQPLVTLSHTIKPNKNTDSIMQIDATKLANVLDDPLFFFDSSGNILFINHTAYAVFSGVKCNQNLFARFRDPQFLNLFKNVATTGKANTIDYNDKGAQQRWFHVAIMAINKDLFVCHFHDHSQIHRLTRMRTDFIANASHELRTPLTSIIGFIETLRGPAQNDKEARARFLIIMQEQAERMARLIHDLLSLSRLETHIEPDHMEPLDIAQLLQHVIESLSPLSKKNHVDIELNLSHPLPLLTANRDGLIQLLQNLLENSLKYAASGKKILVSVKAIGKQFEITIRDYGMGISSQHLPRLTERFYRIDVDESRAHQGTGLGLAIVKHIVTQHRGRLKITSKLGQGSSFTVTLPILPPINVALSHQIHTKNSN